MSSSRSLFHGKDIDLLGRQQAIISFNILKLSKRNQSCWNVSIAKCLGTNYPCYFH